MVNAVRPLFLYCDVKEVPTDSAASILNRSVLSLCLPFL